MCQYIHIPENHVKVKVTPTNSESNDKHSNGEKGGFSRDIEGFRNTRQIGSDNAAGEGNHEASKRHNHGAVPLVRL